MKSTVHIICALFLFFFLFWFLILIHGSQRRVFLLFKTFRSFWNLLCVLTNLLCVFSLSWRMIQESFRTSQTNLSYNFEIKVFEVSKYHPLPINLLSLILAYLDGRRDPLHSKLTPRLCSCPHLGFLLRNSPVFYPFLSIIPLTPFSMHCSLFSKFTKGSCYPNDHLSFIPYPPKRSALFLFLLWYTRSVNQSLLSFTLNSLPGK